MLKEIKNVDLGTHTIVIVMETDGRDQDIHIRLIPTEWYQEESQKFFKEVNGEVVPTDDYDDLDDAHCAFWQQIQEQDFPGVPHKFLSAYYG